MTIEWFNSLRRRAQRSADADAAQARFDAEKRVPLGPYEISMSRLQPKHDSGRIGEVGQRMIAAEQSDAESVEQAWAAALDALPGGLRRMIERAQAELTATEAELAGCYERLSAHERSNPGLADNAEWAIRHQTLLAAVAGVETLIEQRRGTLKGLYKNAARLLDDRIRERAALAEQRLAHEAAERDAAVTAARERYGRAARAARAVGAVRAAVRCDIHELERRLGMSITPEPEKRSRYEQDAKRRELGEILLIEARGAAPRR